MDDQRAGHRLYGELAQWWPLISPPPEYAGEAGFIARVLRAGTIPVRDVLELGSGGGHSAFHLKRSFRLTLLDSSDGMLASSQRLNPECRHLCADMRSVRLRHLFDAVLVGDAVDYMTNEADLAEVMATAFAHCRPGGVAVFAPSRTAESFGPVTAYGGADGPDGRGARFLEWTSDPDPGDTWISTEYAFMLKEASGEVRVVHETHRLGLFGRGTWLRLLGRAGFVAEAVTEEAAADREPRELFAGHRR